MRRAGIFYSLVYSSKTTQAATRTLVLPVTPLRPIGLSHRWPLRAQEIYSYVTMILGPCAVVLPIIQLLLVLVQWYPAPESNLGLTDVRRICDSRLRARLYNQDGHLQAVQDAPARDAPRRVLL